MIFADDVMITRNDVKNTIIEQKMLFFKPFSTEKKSKELDTADE